MQFWAIIVDSFREARDKKLFWVLLFISLVAAGSLACIGFDENGWSLFFGLLKIDDPQYRAGSPAAAEIMARLVANFLVNRYVGVFGVLVCLIATAGVFPSFMEGGNIDVTLSKPMSRTAVFLGKYTGSLSFVFVQSAFFVLLSFVILRVKVGQWYWGYLWSIPLLVALFSFLYCVCVLLGVWTRSALASLLLTLLFWACIPGIGVADEVFSGRVSFGGQAVAERTWAEESTAGKVVHVARVILPKTGEIPQLVANFMGAASTEDLAELLPASVSSDVTEEQWKEIREQDRRLARLSVLWVLGTSLLFEACVLAIACWSFQRKDF